MIAIIKYNAGNITSVKNALNRLHCESIITNTPSEIMNADKVIFPGVGEASSAMNFLRDNRLDEVILSLTKPLLAICLGLHLLCKHSEEGNTACLGIFNTQVKSFPPLDLVPQMGWNNFDFIRGPLFRGISPNQDVYFVHGYYAEMSRETTSVTDYILPFSSSMQKDNYYATQFHPEKSADVGQLILNNFLSL